MTLPDPPARLVPPNNTAATTIKLYPVHIRAGSIPRGQHYTAIAAVKLQIVK